MAHSFLSVMLPICTQHILRFSYALGLGHLVVKSLINCALDNLPIWHSTTRRRSFDIEMLHINFADVGKLVKEEMEKFVRTPY